MRNTIGELSESTDLVRDMPAVFGFDCNEDFVPDRFLQEASFNWGNQAKRTDADGQRGWRLSHVCCAELLFYLGIRTVYLLGCDFRMQYGEKNYAFEQSRTKSSIQGNSRSYEVLNIRLGRLRPIFETAGFNVFNCTPNSGLVVFPHVAYELAVETALKDFPRQIVTTGMYDRIQRERDIAKTFGRDAMLHEGPADVAAASSASIEDQGICVSTPQDILNGKRDPTAQPAHNNAPSVYEYFEKAFVINLPNRTDRLAHVTAECDRVGIRFERFEAICPNHRERFATSGQYGCFMSHLEIWRAALAAKFTRLLVLEDDVVFSSEFRARFTSVVSELRKSSGTYSTGPQDGVVAMESCELFVGDSAAISTQ